MVNVKREWPFEQEDLCDRPMASIIKNRLVYNLGADTAQ
jgi:hypothetical protein